MRFEEAFFIRRRTVAATGLLALIFGFLLGSIFPQEHLPWGIESDTPKVIPHVPVVVVEDDAATLPAQSTVAKVEAGTASANKAPEKPALNPKENFPLLNAACCVVQALQSRDYNALAGYVHRERGLTITPYSTVREEDLTFKRSQVKNFSGDDNLYVWGVVPETNELIHMTPMDFFNTYLWDMDYTQASKIAVDKVNISGNALENVTQVYPDCRFVEFTFPSVDASMEGLDWRSLKVVLTPADDQWQLVGLIHGQWTA